MPGEQKSHSSPKHVSSRVSEFFSPALESGVPARLRADDVQRPGELGPDPPVRRAQPRILLPLPAQRGRGVPAAAVGRFGTEFHFKKSLFVGDLFILFYFKLSLFI